VPDLKEILKELQATDTELHDLIGAKERIPHIVEGLEAEISELKRRFEETKAALTDARKGLKMAELNLATHEEAIGKYNSQLYSAKTNEEYKAFLKEIETAEAKKKEAEDRIIEIMEKIEAEEAELVTRENSLKTDEKTKLAEIQEVKASLASLEEEIKKINDKYERLRSELPADILSAYDRIKQKKDGIAVASIKDGDRCSACLNPVPAQNVIEAAHSDSLIYCEYCGRILLP
jgi:uncharacterized protein